MAKNKMNSKPVPKKGKPRASRRRSTPISSAAGIRSAYAQLLISPDSGMVPPTGVYDGELGNFKRFVSSLTFNTVVGHTCGLLTFCPGTGNGFAVSSTASNIGVTFSSTNVGFPGATYLGANALKVRGIASVLELIPSAASITNITGEVAAGFGTPGLVSGTSTVDNLFDISKAYGPIERKAYRSCWSPSGLDHTYEVYNTGATEDRNVAWVAYRGWPAGVAITVRMTYVVEYVVKPNVGSPPTGRNSQALGHHDVISVLQTRDSHWHHNIKSDARELGGLMLHDVGRFARAGLNAGLHKLGSSLFKAAPALLM